MRTCRHYHRATRYHVQYMPLGGENLQRMGEGYLQVAHPRATARRSEQTPLDLRIDSQVVVWVVHLQGRPKVFLADMGIALRHRNRAVPQDLLHDPNVGAAS